MSVEGVNGFSKKSDAVTEQAVVNDGVVSVTGSGDRKLRVFGNAE